jgi:hypothetical protein
MRKIIGFTLFAVLFGVGVLSLMHTARGQASGSLNAPSVETQGENLRQIEGDLPADDATNAPNRFHRLTVSHLLSAQPQP